jgi:hypothetical protein
VLPVQRATLLLLAVAPESARQALTPGRVQPALLTLVVASIVAVWGTAGILKVSALPAGVTRCWQAGPRSRVTDCPGRPSTTCRLCRTCLSWLVFTLAPGLSTAGCFSSPTGAPPAS